MVPLASGSLLLFSDIINENFKHTIIEDKSVRGQRISVADCWTSTVVHSPRRHLSSRFGNGFVRRQKRRCGGPFSHLPSLRVLTRK